ncbi:hypothetical protein [Embleya hyalina]|uniref:Uncharacterized protein n=1 Tax=Embleya hyalina TaxID=516124 RepID=A0A401Z5V5_9ACTN|nr:hypothetical protein [Embleya hyalina]GCE02227.1 hypothetical protein EHYA_10004 [Embleya hyalina]
MYQPDRPAFTTHSGIVSLDEAGGARESFPDQGAAARAHLLTLWLGEDAAPLDEALSPTGPVPALYADHRRSPSASTPNPATAHDDRHFPHIDATSGTLRKAVACEPIDESELRDALMDAIERPLRDRGGELGSRARLLLDEFILDLTGEFLDAVVVEALDTSTGRVVRDELHVIVVDYRGSTRVSVLPEAAGLPRGSDPTPDPRCTFGGLECSDEHFLDDDQLHRVNVRLRAACAARILADGLVMSHTGEVVFDVRIAPHDLRSVDATTIRSWLPPAAWEIEQDDAHFHVLDTREWLKDLDAFRKDCLEEYGGNEGDHEYDDPSVVKANRTALAGQLWAESVDAPLRYITRGHPATAAETLGVVGTWDHGHTIGSHEFAGVMVFGPHEVLLLSIYPEG